MLTLKQLDKTFGAGTASAHHALCGIDLTLQDGEFVTVIGSNGAGKSTLFGAVSGSFFVDRGRIVLDGEDITYLPEHQARKAHRAYLSGPDARHSARSDAGGKRGARVCKSRRTPFRTGAAAQKARVLPRAARTARHGIWRTA